MKHHSAFDWLRNIKHRESHVARWGEFPPRYQFEVPHRPKRVHVILNSLSRLTLDATKNVTGEVFLSTPEPRYVNNIQMLLSSKCPVCLRFHE